MRNGALRRKPAASRRRCVGSQAGWAFLLYVVKYLLMDTHLRIYVVSAFLNRHPRMPSAPTPSLPEIPGDAATALAFDAADERRQLATRILGDALLLGVVGDAVLRAPSWGVNMTVWTVAVLVALITLARRRHDTIPADARWLMAPALAIAVLFAWRGSESLAVYNGLAVVGTLALLASAMQTGSSQSILTSRVRDIVVRVFSIGIGALATMPMLVVVDVSLRDVKSARGTTRLVSAIRAALLAIPLLLVFGGLFASADPVFARILGDLFDIDAEVVVSHVMLSGFLAWIVGGFLRTALLSNRRADTILPFPDGALGLTEVSVALGSLVLLFAAFVVVQFRYFFGGEALVSQTAGMGYADYARRGFFELVTVSALVLPVLLSANALLRRDTPHAVRIYRALASTLLVLLAVIMYSAIARMRLYQSVYGWSTDRLDATVFMAWLALVFVWFAFTVLRGRDRRFVGGLLVSAWGTLVALNIADPAGLVTRANIARAEQGKELDVSYIASLGADAAPALVEYLVRQPLSPPATWTARSSGAPTPVELPASASPSAEDPTRTGPDDFTARCGAARRLLTEWGSSRARDWRGWSIAAERARSAVASNETKLHTLAGRDAAGGTYIQCPAPPAASSRGTVPTT